MCYLGLLFSRRIGKRERTSRCIFLFSEKINTFVNVLHKESFIVGIIYAPTIFKERSLQECSIKDSASVEINTLVFMLQF